MHSIYSRDAPVLATLIDHHAQNNPATPIYVFPSSNGARSQISHYEFSRACERVGRLIQPDITNLQEEVVGLIGDCDTLVYQTVVAGCACQGIVVCTSQRPPLSRIINMVQRRSSPFHLEIRRLPSLISFMRSPSHVC